MRLFGWDLDVVDPAGVELDGVGEDRRGRIGHVPRFHPVVHVGPDVGVVAAVHPLEDPGVARVVVRGGAPPDHDQLGLLDARRDLGRRRGRPALAVHRGHAVGAGPLGDEDALGPFGLDLGAGAADAPLRIEGGGAAGLEADDVAGAGPDLGGDDLDGAGGRPARP